jgi:hypothetical protein
MIPEDFDQWPDHEKEGYIAAMQREGHSPRVKRNHPPDNFDSWPEEQKQEYIAALQHQGYSPRITRRSAKPERSTRTSATKSASKSGRKSKSGRRSSTKSGRKSPPKNRTWKEYLYEHSGKAVALASVVAIVGSIVATAPTLTAAGIYSHLLTGYGPRMAELFSSNSSYIMSKVGGVTGTIGNAASKVYGYGKTLLGYGATAAGYAQTANMTVQGATHVYAAGKDIAEGLGGDDINVGKVLQGVQRGTMGITSLQNAQNNYNNINAANDANHQNALIADCKTIMRTKPSGPYTAEEQLELAKCDSMMEVMKVAEEQKRKQEEEDAKNKYASLKTVAVPKVESFSLMGQNPMGYMR